jgi:hypothetical protein
VREHVERIKESLGMFARSFEAEYPAAAATAELNISLCETMLRMIDELGP